MTSVVAILNREGVALAADSAVTRNRVERGGFQQKHTKNGNKMIRLNSTGRVSIMITGNADFLGIPWDVIARRYRDLRGTMAFDTIEDVTIDFFDFISSMDIIWAEDACASSVLIISGYGEKQDYPSLVAATVSGSIDRRVNYQIRPEDIVRISDERPVAICPFAQVDVVDALLEGAHRDWIYAATRKMKWLCGQDITSLFEDQEGRVDPEILKALCEIRTDDISEMLNDGINQHLGFNRQEWEKTLVDADIKSMALLAESLIELTGFHRVLTFAQEEVGGLVDLAFIPRSGKFTWLNRKSWYHQKLFCGNVTSIVCNSN